MPAEALGLAEPQRRSLMKSTDWFSSARGKDALRRRLVAAAREQLRAEEEKQKLIEATLARVAVNVRNLRAWLDRQEDLP